MCDEATDPTDKTAGLRGERGFVDEKDERVVHVSPDRNPLLESRP